jgi:hypothetical protein
MQGASRRFPLAATMAFATPGEDEDVRGSKNMLGTQSHAKFRTCLVQLFSDQLF